ncbi:MAG: hypothetical protein KJ798_14000 [Gammaproteobacteria bacterium]|nr:hypothetical protein [Gammaproteobacteria bacterium]MBU0849147.1 hypothetical protein [Gammaproteobacteria bacterium]MBU1267898.1 hypothetical protein [Gammaproteobacteria bacterium]MBU1528347.1 hypothetical protein [Gammaproteobacteria bacterium]MBU1781484.1 hypothetical protein [Gammaproteobacteria bacterium]
MKKLTSFLAAVALAAAFASNSVWAQKDDHSMNPQHGGVVVEASHVQFELVSGPDGVQLFARDHGKPVDMSKATGKLTMLLNNKDKLDVELTGQAESLIGKLPAPVEKEYVALAFVKMPSGKNITVRFQSK